ncbi:MAG TPA: pyrimidine-nucleoside phosphorylase [Candidatus Avamphibacillus intestinigallinarum]|nr:pyrimidine-nucleoside phosphorylase [Candidatus Avamphibacillus intestinigallinarum]
MRMYDIIQRKRDGYALTKEEINYFISGYTNGEIPDYQVSALLMAIYLKHMNADEATALTNAMVRSGDQIDLSSITGIKVDKHSTGGVGDTTSLILGPLVASLGIPIAKMSGRGLGHTGGTIDKMESIPGFQAEVTTDEFIELVNKNKLAIVGQSGNLTPADKLLYSLRDVTATVDSIPLIASSVMSKKIAAGADAIVLDVKTGTGAFMKNLADAEELATTMVNIGKLTGKDTTAMITDMNQPLGRMIGNALEIQEAIQILSNKGPDDLRELCLELGSQMVVSAKKAETGEEARRLLEENLANGQALQEFRDFIYDQGGDIKVIDHPEDLPQAKYKYELRAKTSGYVEEMSAEKIGYAAMLLGAGRETKESVIDLAVGIELHKKIGDAVQTGEALLTIYANDQDVTEVKDILSKHIQITKETVTKPTLIYKTIQ